MGHFYVTITLRGPSQDLVLTTLIKQGRLAYVSPTVNHNTVIYDAECDDQDTIRISEITANLSSTFQCPALAVLNHDDDLLWYHLYDCGRLLDTYDSNPAFSDPSSQSSDPIGGNASILCRRFGSLKVEQVVTMLRQPTTTDTYLFAVERHYALMQALGLPTHSVGFGYEDIVDDNVPEDIDMSDFKHAE